MERNDLRHTLEAELKNLPKCAPNKPAAAGPRPAGYPPIGAYASKPFASESMAAMQILSALRNIKLDDDASDSVNEHRRGTLIQLIVREAKHCGHLCNNAQAENILSRILG